MSNLLISTLKRLNELMTQNDFAGMASEYDKFESKRIGSVSHQESIVINFLDAWVDEANHNFQGAYQGISREDWFELSQEIIKNLEAEKKIINKKILDNFDFRNE